MTYTSDLRAKAILSRLGKNPVGAEIGVYRGSLSRRLLARRDLRLTMIDRWGPYREMERLPGDMVMEHDETEWHNIKEAADVVTRFADDRRTIVQADSLAAARDIPDHSLDFVFIDAGHSYEECLDDILAWYPKLRPGGLLAGHDYSNDRFDWGVDRAVNEFVEMQNSRRSAGSEGEWVRDKQDPDTWRRGAFTYHGDKPPADQKLVVETDEDYTWFVRMPGDLPEPSTEYDQIVICCVKWGTKYDAGYVNILADMVARNCELPYQFHCFTDDGSGLAEDIEVRHLPPGLEGWWNKVYLFKSDLFPDKTRLVFLDLDVVVSAGIEDLINTKGIAADWLQGGYNSSVMVWDNGEHRDIWNKFKPDTAGRFHGDQDWITELGGWDYLPTDWVVSYRLHAQEWPPEKAKVVAFHGQPKPHEITTGWVPEMWTMHGLAIPRYTSQLNNDILTIRNNVEVNASRREVPGIEEAGAHTRPLIIAAGGPSLAEHLTTIQLMRVQDNAELWVVNGVHDYMLDHGIVPDKMVMLDSRLQCVSAFLSRPRHDVEYLIATQCDPAAFDVLRLFNVRRWTGWYWGVEKLDERWIGGGATVGLKSIALAATLGYRDIRLFGYDSSYRDTANHAYPQPMNDDDLKVDVVVKGRKFVAARWMVKQVVEFLAQAATLTEHWGCEFRIYGDGLLPWAAAQAEVKPKERNAA